jgi:hypothetical protein
MKHLTYAEKSLLVGDTAADLTLQYGAILANQGRADTVTLLAIGADGDIVVATLLLDAGSNLMAESTNSPLDEPDNTETENYIRERMRFLSSPHTALPADEPPFDMDELQTTDFPGT